MTQPSAIRAARSRIGSAAATPTTAFVLGALAALRVYADLPAHVQVIAYIAIGLVSVGVVLWAATVRHPAPSRDWLLLAAALSLEVAGDIAYSVLPAGSLAPDLVYVVAQVTLVMAVARIVLPTDRLDFTVILDAALVTVATAVIAWPVLLRGLVAPGAHPLDAAMVLVFPLLDLIMLGVLARHLFTDGLRDARVILAAAALAWLAADLGWVQARTASDYSPGSLLDYAWLVGYLLFALAALHPGGPPRSEAGRFARLGKIRLGAISLAVFVPLLVLAVQPLTTSDDYVGAAIEATILGTLATLRVIAALRASDAAAAALAEREWTLRTVFELAPVGIVVDDAAGTRISANAAALALLDAQRHDADPSAGASAAASRETDPGRPSDRKVRIRSAADPSGITVTILEDVSGEVRLAAATQRAASIVEAADDAIIQMDFDGRVTAWNGAAQRIYGWSAGEVVGRLTRDFMPADRLVQTMSIIDRVRATGETVRFETERITKDGRRFAASIAYAPIRDPDGSVAGMVAISRDLTHEHELQAQLRHAQKMEAVGTLAAGVAHDFNNLLSVILGFTELLLADRSGDDPERADLEAMRDAATRGATLTRQLLAFSRREILDLRPVDLTAVARGALPLLRQITREGPALELDLATELPAVNADRASLEHVLLNLVSNARDAAGRTGTVRIETGAESRADGTDVWLSVVDNGAGMDQATHERIFDPFFTTKAPGAGTGLGLASVHGLVAQSGGRIEVESAPGEGTRMTITLPAIDASVEPSDASPPSPVAHEGRERILLVEDNELVRRSTAAMLRAAGFDVVQAGCVDEAELALESQLPDVVLTDVAMPGRSGAELAAAIAERGAGLPVVLMSGYATDALRDIAALDESRLLRKPFTSTELLEAIERATAHSAS